MAGIRFTAQTFRGGGQVFERALIDAARPVIRNACNECADQAKHNIVSNIRATTGQRQGKARSEPLADEARYPVTVNTSNTGAQMNFRVVGSAAFKAKFGALNYGSGPHEISGAKMGNVDNPSTDRRKKGFFAVGTVTHPGTAGRRFFEDGIEQALSDFRRFL